MVNKMINLSFDAIPAKVANQDSVTPPESNQQTVEKTVEVKEKTDQKTEKVEVIKPEVTEVEVKLES